MICPENTAVILADLAKRTGLSLTGTGRINVEGIVGSCTIRTDEGAAIEIGGTVMPIVEWYEDLAKTAPGYFVQTAKPEGARSGQTITERMTAAKATKRRDRSNEAEELVAKYGNPWRKAAWNITRQMTLTNAAPEMAARLKGEAAR